MNSINYNRRNLLEFFVFNNMEYILIKRCYEFNYAAGGDIWSVFFDDIGGRFQSNEKSLSQ